MNQIWGTTPERIFFYFDTDCMIVYPEDKGGFDRVYARIHIRNLPGETQGPFLSNYTIKSQKEKNAILVAPQSLAQFIDNLKVLVDLGYEAQFKLTQSNSAETGEVRKYIDITGSTPATKDVVRCFIEINCFFDVALYPEEITQKEVNFVLDSPTCQCVLTKFAQRFNIISDDFAKLVFTAATQGKTSPSDRNSEFNLELSSRHMRAQVTNRSFQGLYADATNMKGKYKVDLKKEVFSKFFSVLKISPGTAALKLDHKKTLEMEYTVDKCPHIRVIVETPSRSM